MKDAIVTVQACRQHSNFAAALRDLDLITTQDLIDKADVAYYRTGLTPILTDAEYDALKAWLKELDDTDLRLTRVGDPFLNQVMGTKARHTIPMGSLDNTDDGILGYVPWVTNLAAKMACPLPAIIASLKIDGGSICATYERGRLVRVTTRGNGEEGEDITKNGALFRNLPVVLPLPVTIGVRGEAILYKDDFKAICDRDGILEADRSNPRNLGNGIMGRHDGQDADKIRFLAFNLVLGAGETALTFSTEGQKFTRLKDLGFTVVPHRLCTTLDEFQQFYTKVVTDRDRFPFEIDGIVVVLDQIDQQNKFVTADPKSRLRPKYARAVKFPHKFNTTELLDVGVTIGHTRMIIPTAVLREVRIGGVNVTSALLNNYDEITRLGIAIGDTVEVILAGDIIPKITRVVSQGNPRVAIVEPATCPSCHAATTRVLRSKAGACTYCSNTKCAAAVFAKLDQWIGTSKKGVGILDLGDTMIKAMWDNGLIADPADLYCLTVDQLKNLAIGKGSRIGQSRAEKIVGNITNKRCLPLHTFLGSLGIELLGRRRVVQLREAAAGQLDKLEDWLDSEKLRTIQLPGFGDAIRVSIIQGMDENRALITKLLANGVTIDYGAPAVNGDEPAAPAAGLPFAGLSFCLTGTRAYQDDIVRLGGTLKSGVSKGLDFLVQADANSVSNKTKKAEEYGTQIISIDYLRQAVSGIVVLTRAEKVAVS